MVFDPRKKDRKKPNIGIPSNINGNNGDIELFLTSDGLVMYGKFNDEWIPFSQAQEKGFLNKNIYKSLQIEKSLTLKKGSKIKLYGISDKNYTSFRQATDATVNIEYVLPKTAAGSNKILQSDSNNQLSWVTASTDTDTTYSISCADGDNSDEEKIVLTAGGSGSGTDTVVLEAGTGLSIARSSDKITFTNTVTDTDTVLTAEQVQDIVGAMFSSNTETGITATYVDGDNNIDLVVDDTTKLPLAGGTLTGALTIHTAADGLLNLKTSDDGSFYIQFQDNAGDRHAYIGMDSDHDRLHINASENGANEIQIDTTNLDINAAVQLSGALTTDSTIDGVDIAARDAVLTSTTTTANAALPLTGGDMTGHLQITATDGNHSGSGAYVPANSGDGSPSWQNVLRLGSTSDNGINFLIDDAGTNKVSYYTNRWGCQHEWARGSQDTGDGNTYQPAMRLSSNDSNNSLYLYDGTTNTANVRITSESSNDTYFNNSDNNVAIGSTSAGGYKLKVTGTANVTTDLTVGGTSTFGSLSDGSITITDFVDEDDMSSNSAVKIPTQQSVKAYVDNSVPSIHWTRSTGGYFSANNTLQYTQSWEGDETWGNTVSLTIPFGGGTPTINYSDVYGALWVAPVDAKVTHCNMIVRNVSYSDDLTIKLYTINPSNLEATQIFTHDITMPNTSSIVTVNETLSSSNSVPQGHALLATIKKQATTGTSRHYFTWTVSGTYD